MHVATAGLRLVFTLLFIAIAGRTASAQSGPYVSGTVFGDIKRFGGTDIDRGDDEDDSFDATGLGGSVRVGTWVHPQWTLELGVDVGSKTTSSFTNPIQIQIFPPIPPFEIKNSNSFMSVSTVVGFHPRADGRIRFGYLAGFSFVRGRYSSDYPDFILPSPIFSGVATRFATISGSINGVVLPRPFVRTTRTETQYRER